MTAPFNYPSTPHTRRHGPQGYANPASFRPWLRDEFSFRCVYCLVREQWVRHGSFGVEHLLAVALHPDKANDYDNLLYACATCNAAKGDRATPDPLQVLTSAGVQVAADGKIHSSDHEAAHLIELLGLDSEQSREYRMLWIGIVALAAKEAPELYKKLMGFPSDLPNLARLRPPGGNTRPDGIGRSYLEQKKAGTLSETY